MDAKEIAQRLIQYEDSPAQAPPKLIQECVNLINRKNKALALAAIGGEGIVIKALDETGQKICIKICKGGLVSSSSRKSHNAILYNVANFLRGQDLKNIPEERFKAGCILQRNIYKELIKEKISFFSVPIVFEIRSDPFPFISMEWHESPGLLRFLSQKNSMVFSMSIFQKILGCVIFLHERGILHRDWKADNLKIDENETIIILDWTLAKELGDRNITIPGTIGGTPGFAPGKFIEEKNFKSANYLDDLYQIGFLFWEVCTQQRLPKLAAVECTSKNIFNFRKELVEYLPEACKSIFWKATEEKEKDRYQSAKEFQDRIKDLILIFSSDHIQFKIKEAPEEIIDTSINIQDTLDIYECENCGKCNETFPCKSLRKSIIDIVLEMKKKGII